MSPVKIFAETQGFHVLKWIEDGRKLEFSKFNVHLQCGGACFTPFSFRHAVQRDRSAGPKGRRIARLRATFARHWGFAAIPSNGLEVAT